jgi:hypothetical protein
MLQVLLLRRGWLSWLGAGVREIVASRWVHFIVLWLWANAFVVIIVTLVFLPFRAVV